MADIVGIIEAFVVRNMEHTAIIPKGEITGLPSVPIDEIGLATMIINLS